MFFFSLLADLYNGDLNIKMTSCKYELTLAPTKEWDQTKQI